jgi:secreted trypsin-like serine protease
MKTAVVILALVALAAAAPKPTKLNFRNLYKQPIKPIDKPVPRIIGGREATPHSIPFQVYIEMYSADDGWYCGGSLISENYILTDARCAYGGRHCKVVLGAHNIQQTENTQEVQITASFIIHEMYYGRQLAYDIALIALLSPASLSDAIQPVGLPKDDSDTYTGDTARASGWGLTDGQGSTISPVLNYVDLEVISQQECEDVFGSLESSIICTSGDKGTGICSGDIGGPLVINGTQIGIASFGVENCPSGSPSGYVRITSFLDWIAKHTGL